MDGHLGEWVFNPPRVRSFLSTRVGTPLSQLILQTFRKILFPSFNRITQILNRELVGSR